MVVNNWLQNMQQDMAHGQRDFPPQKGEASDCRNRMFLCCRGQWGRQERLIRRATKSESEV